ncbi:MAG TPA: SusC/RagA family TonB-linked outer membrane protein [Gemmatimonadales bacterium]|nr:SusC/RagA family TonB-linked outer membrane protein [Gemmatimonadales bacterium]
MAMPLAAQNAGTIKGQVVDSTTRQALAGVIIQVEGTQIQTVSGNDGSYTLGSVPAGSVLVRATRIGYGPQRQSVTVTAGGTADAQFALAPQASLLEAVVVTGYGTQRREAITGSVSTVNPAQANVGVTTNVTQMLSGRASGVDIVQNNGEPGAGAQILIRGGSSISNTNDPLYVIDGVPINNVPTEPEGMSGVVGTPALPRNPLNLLNPADIASITVLKDASATAIYGSRAANGVILVETKKGTGGGGPTIEYDSYVAAASPARRLEVLDGDEYRAYVNPQFATWRSDSTACAARPTCSAGFADSSGGFGGIKPYTLGSANTDWERAVTRTAVTHNHNLSFSGGTEDTRYRASLNYMKDEGVALSSALERIQGRLAGTHHALNNRLRLGLNVTTSRVNNQYLTFDNTGGFEGGVFQNVAIFDPTQPVTFSDASGTHFYEGGGSSVRNPVALAEQLVDIGQTTRTLGNATAEVDIAGGLTGQVTVGLDHATGSRQTYYPKANPIGNALGGGVARVADLDNSTRTLQTLLTYRRESGDKSFDVVGGYEYNKFATSRVDANGSGFFTDAFSFDNLGAATTRNSSSYAEQSLLVSFFSRANFGYKSKYFFTGALRYDGSSKFAAGHQWSSFPGISASWHLSDEGFMQSSPFSDLRLRVGWGVQGNPGISAYSALPLLAAGGGGTYTWGDTPQTGVAGKQNPNPDLKWERTAQFDIGVDFGLMSNRLTGSVEYYVKNTSDLLLSVKVPQPAVVEERLENVGKLRNRGFELSLDVLAISRPTLTWRAGLTFAASRNKVTNLGPYAAGLTSGGVSGQGQSGQVSQLIRKGLPLGTFYGPLFLGVDANGKQVFACTSASTNCTNGRTNNGAGPAADDYRVIGNANPDFTVGLHNQLTFGKLDLSFLIRASIGQDVFNNTALVYSTKGNALQGKNFLRPALTDGIGLHEPAIFSSLWVENGSFVRLQNITLEYQLNLPMIRSVQSARVYVSADNLLLLTGYSGLDPEVYASSGLASRGIDYLSYPRPRTITGGLRLMF